MNGFLVERVLRKGKRLKGRFFVVFKYPTKSLHPAMTVVCSTKVSKRAVDRNLLKRQVREIIRVRIIASEFESCHLVVLINKEALGVCFEELQKN